MNWVKHRLVTDQQYVLGLIVSQLSSDIHEFNRLPARLRCDHWSIRPGAKRFKLLMAESQTIASVLQHAEGGLRDDRPLLELRAEENHVSAQDTRGTGAPPMAVIAHMDAGKIQWRVESETDTPLNGELWQVSERLLGPLFFPGEENP